MQTRDQSAGAALVTNGVLALSGYGLRIAVERGQLVVEDGVGESRRTACLPRVGSGIERLIVLGHSGTVSLEALRWLHEIGAAFVQLSADGELIATGAPHALSDVRLRRRQAHAMGTETGLSVARTLLVKKVQGQAKVLDTMPGERAARQIVKDALGQLAEAQTLERLRFVESRAAAAYWGAWEDIPIHFAGRDAKHLPPHWRTFGTRRSVLSASPRKAATPANALLNYLYAIVEAEARLAALAVGCDPALGVIHVDAPSRDSLACDLMEPIRPKVDAYVLRLLARTTFHRSDFFERRDGNCRLMPELTVPLAATAPIWAKALAPVAERIAGDFLRLPVAERIHSQSVTKSVASSARHRTPLTGANRSRPKSRVYALVESPSRSAALPARCRDCGTDLGRRKRVYCDACLPKAARAASAKGAATLTMQRAVGVDGRTSEHARALHSRNALAQNAANKAWDEAHPLRPSPTVFRKELLPRIATVAVRELVAATGLSESFCKQMRKGECTPHPRHWDAIRRLVALNG